MFALVVSLTVRSEHREKLVSAVKANAEASMRLEPGCLYFDVCEQVADRTRILLYEVYRDEDAYEDHRRTPHFAEWRIAADACLEDGSQTNTPALVLFSSLRI